MEEQEETNSINSNQEEQNLTPENTEDKEEIFTRDIEDIGSLGVQQSTSTNINSPGAVASLAGREEDRLAGAIAEPEAEEEDLSVQYNGGSERTDQSDGHNEGGGA